MGRRVVEISVGLFVVAAIAALVMLATRVTSNELADLADGYDVVAKFENIGGLTLKAPVSMAGVKIGRVSAIDIDRDDYTAIVTMRIGSSHDNLPNDTSASILTAGLLGAQYIGLEPGGDDKFLSGGDEIKLTQSAVILEQLIGQLIFGRSEGAAGNSN